MIAGVALLLREPRIDPAQEVARQSLLRDVLVPRVGIDRAADDERAAALRCCVGLSRRDGIRAFPAAGEGAGAEGE